MKSSKHFFRNSVSYAVLFAAFILALSIGTSGAKKPKNIKIQNTSPRIQNKTRAFEIVQTNELMQAKASDEHMKLLLRNGYDKNITAFVLSVNELVSMVDFVYSEGEEQHGILPQAIYTWPVSYTRPEEPEIASQESLDIHVLGVVFDDKTSEGDAKAIAPILNGRMESKKQLITILQLLTSNSTKITDQARLDQLKTQISSLSMRSQISSIREDVLQHLNLHNDLGPREKIEHITEACKNLLARL